MSPSGRPRRSPPSQAGRKPGRRDHRAGPSRGRSDVGAAARRVAVEALVRIERDGAYANLLVPRLLDSTDLSAADRRFVTELVYGVTRLRRMLDHRIDAYLLRPVDTPTRAALRVGAYQLLVLATPPHAAVAATVAAVGGPSRTLVNAVLRRLAAQTASPAEAGAATVAGDKSSSWPDDATRLSYPDWVVDRLSADLGREAAVGALEAMNHPAVVTERADGYVQDLASQWVAELVEVAPGERVADLCAAPGGKATALARMGAGVVAAVDLRPARIGLVGTNRSTLGLPAVTPIVADGRRPPLRRAAFNRVLVDAPCSGLGALRRRPDARWRIAPDAIPRLVELQRELVAAALDLLAPGGTLVYSVCTLTEAETLGIDRWLAELRPELVPAEQPGGPWLPLGRGAMLLPQAAGTDGMYLLRLVAPPAGEVAAPPAGEVGDSTSAAARHGQGAGTARLKPPHEDAAAAEG